jgi:hypothetical protein
MRYYTSDQEFSIFISKEQYNAIIHYLFINQIGYEEYSKTHLSNYSGSTFKFYNMFGLKSITNTDIDHYLAQFSGRLGETRKRYNPYVWSQEIIFNTDQDAVMFILKVL